MTDTTTGTPPTPPAPPANGAPPAQPPAPVPAPPAQPPAPAPPAAQPPAVETPNGKTFTQTDLDRILTDRLDRQQKAFNEKLAKFFGGDTGEGDSKAAPDPVEQAQAMIDQAQARANTATARSFAQSAQIKPDRIDTLVGMVDMKAALSGVDSNDLAAVDAAIKAAITAKVAEFPEWKATAVPAASTANPNGVGGIPNIDERIAAAQKAGDHTTAITLKRAKARQKSG